MLFQVCKCDFCGKDVNEKLDTRTLDFRCNTRNRLIDFDICQGCYYSIINHIASLKTFGIPLKEYIASIEFCNDPSVCSARENMDGFPINYKKGKIDIGVLDTNKFDMSGHPLNDKLIKLNSGYDFNTEEAYSEKCLFHQKMWGLMTEDEKDLICGRCHSSNDHSKCIRR
jgi:hypothetical protein